MILVQNLNTDEFAIFKNVEAVLREINSDRSESFRPYTKHDWKDGLENMTEFKLISTKARFKGGVINIGDYI